MGLIRFEIANVISVEPSALRAALDLLREIVLPPNVVDIEGNPDARFIETVEAIRPTQVTLVPDDIRPPEIDEDPKTGELPRPYCARMAREKAAAGRAAAPGPEPVLGADTAFGTPGYCRLDYGQFFSLIPDETRLNAYGALTGDFGDTRVTLRAAWADTQLTRGNSPSLPALSFPTIPVDNPGNYFNRDVTWNGRPRGVSAGAARRSFDHDTLRLEAGLAHDFDAFGRDWTAEGVLAFSRNELEATITDHIGDRLDAALNGFGGANCQPGASAGDQSAGCYWFNPFGSGSLVTDPNDPRYNDPALLAWMLGEDVRTSSSELSSLDASLTTAHLFALPAGSVSLTVGAHLRNERLDVDHGQTFNDDAFLFIVGGPDYAGERDVASLYAESVIPLHARARLTLAARYEDLEDFSSTDPKVGLAVDLTDATHTARCRNVFTIDTFGGQGGNLQER